MEQVKKVLIEWAPIYMPVVIMLVTYGLSLLGKAIKDYYHNKANAEQKKWIAMIAQTAYWIVEQISRKTPTTWDDEVAVAFKEIVDSLGHEFAKSCTGKVLVALKSASESIGRPLKAKEAKAIKAELRGFHESKRRSSYDMPQPPSMDHT